MAKLSIIYAYRNRDFERIKISLESLKNQTDTDFEVVFVDYGSTLDKANAVAQILNQFDFATYYYIAHPGLLWNKSKALNYGALKSDSSHIFVADVDICFAIEAVSQIKKNISANTFTLFKLSYLKENAQLKPGYQLDVKLSDIKHHGTINGMIVVAKEDFLSVKGYDEIYHFYGSEDVDFYDRLSNKGLKKTFDHTTLFYHQWHPIQNRINDAKLLKNPKLFNIKKINLVHQLYQKNTNAITPLFKQDIKANIWCKDDELTQNDATLSFELVNDHANVWHCIKMILPNLKNEIVCIKVTKDIYFDSLKYKLKKTLNKPDRIPISMKTVNDLMLQEIVLCYRHHNYTYTISEDLNTIFFIIKL